MDLLNACKRSREREIEAVILKNRNGRTGGKVGFIYHALFNHFGNDTDFKPENESDFNPFE